MSLGNRMMLPGSAPASAVSELQGPTPEQLMFARHLLAQRQREAIEAGSVPTGGGDAARESVINSILEGGGEEGSQISGDQIAPALMFEQYLAQNRDMLASPDRTQRSYAFGASGILPYAAAMLKKPLLNEQLRQQREERKIKAGERKQKTKESEQKIAESKARTAQYVAGAEAIPYTSGQIVSPLEEEKLKINRGELASLDSYRTAQIEVDRSRIGAQLDSNQKQFLVAQAANAIELRKLNSMDRNERRRLKLEEKRTSLEGWAQRRGVDIAERRFDLERFVEREGIALKERALSETERANREQIAVEKEKIGLGREKLGIQREGLELKRDLGKADLELRSKDTDIRERLGMGSLENERDQMNLNYQLGLTQMDQQERFQAAEQAYNNAVLKRQRKLDQDKGRMDKREYLLKKEALEKEGQIAAIKGQMEAMKLDRQLSKDAFEKLAKTLQLQNETQQVAASMQRAQTDVRRFDHTVEQALKNEKNQNLRMLQELYSSGAIEADQLQSMWESAGGPPIPEAAWMFSNFFGLFNNGMPGGGGTTPQQQVPAAPAETLQKYLE